MTTDTMIRELQGYYGRYNPYVRKYATQWLNKRPDAEKPYLFGEPLKSYPASLRCAPGIKELEDALKAVRREHIHKLRHGQIEDARDYEIMTEAEKLENIEKLKEIINTSLKNGK